MNQPITIIGIGEIAAVLARAFLRNEYPIFPVTRNMDIAVAVNEVPEPLMVVVAVAEKDYPLVMESIPDPWRDRLVLIQNELLPDKWEVYRIENPTILSVWFEKKKGIDTNSILPTPMYGPHAKVIAESLEGIDVPCKVMASADDMLLELVQKNVYVFTINIAGLFLDEGTTTSSLWENHQELALKVANDVIDLQEAITGQTLSGEQLLEGMVKGFKGDPHHICKGRSAPGRLTRAIQLADEKGLEIRYVRDLGQQFE
ncbi:MAG: hypothetical protein CMI18_06640 [Opitutaceae bacterium]|nr:hypothetical protein [Opitutaceae bacterium]|tara:strand:+ start:982 stop:1755 length:774 start_codon:yes stop_codon:yes gene_type:complete